MKETEPELLVFSYVLGFSYFYYLFTSLDSVFLIWYEILNLLRFDLGFLLRLNNDFPSFVYSCSSNFFLPSSDGVHGRYDL